METHRQNEAKLVEALGKEREAAQSKTADLEEASTKLSRKLEAAESAYLGGQEELHR